jgi:hypothetical protein
VPDHALLLRLKRRLIVGHEAAIENRHQQFVIDGEVVVLGVKRRPRRAALAQAQQSSAALSSDILALVGDGLSGPAARAVLYA